MGITYIRKLLNSLKKWGITAYEDIDTIEDLRNYLFDETDNLSEKCNHMIDSAKVIEDSWTKKVFFALRKICVQLNRRRNVQTGFWQTVSDPGKC